MPGHIITAHLAAMVAPLAGALALVHPFARSWRSRLVVPLLVVSVVSLALVIVAGEQGGQLLDQVEASAPDREVEAATDHGEAANLLAASGFFLVVTSSLAAAAVRWNWAGRTADVIGALVGLCGAGVLVGAWIAVDSALTAVWGS